MQDLLHETLKRGKETVSTAQALADKSIIGLYFSLRACGPCQEFTPKLAQVYDDIQEKYDDVEIVYLPYDHNQEDFDAYYAEMPWLALPYADIGIDLSKELGKTFDVYGPALLFLNPQGEILTRDGIALVEQHGHDVDELIEAIRKP